MSNPDYILPKTGNREIWNELYSDMSISDLAKKGFKLKDIDMLMKGREARKYLQTQEAAEKGLDTGIKMHERTDTNEISNILEDLYFRGDDIYKMPMKEWITKIPEHFAEGGRTGFHRGSLRHQKTHDYRAYEKSGDWLRQSPPDNWLMTLLGQKKMGAVVPERDDFETMMKERFMYGEHKPTSNFEQIWADIKKLLDKKRNKHATGGISNLFQERQGYRGGKAVELVTKLPEFLKFVEGLLIKASNQIRRGQGKWKDLDIKQKTVQHDNLTKLVTEFQKTKKFDPKMNEYFGIDAEKAFIEAQSKVKAQKELRVEIKKGVEDVMKDTSEAGLAKSIEIDNLRLEFPGISDELIANILTDTNPQRIAEVKQTMREALKMGERGMSPDDIINTFKESFKRKKQAAGGLIPGYATGGVSNLFRSR